MGTMEKAGMALVTVGLGLCVGLMLSTFFLVLPYRLYADGDIGSPPAWYFIGMGVAFVFAMVGAPLLLIGQHLNHRKNP